MRFIKFLTEGIVSRTSQTRYKAAIRKVASAMKERSGGFRTMVDFQRDFLDAAYDWPSSHIPGHSTKTKTQILNTYMYFGMQDDPALDSALSFLIQTYLDERPGLLHSQEQQKWLDDLLSDLGNEYIFKEGIVSRTSQADKKIPGAINTIATALYRAEPRDGFNYANLLLTKFDNEMEPIGRQWHRISNKKALLDRVVDKLGVQPADQITMKRAMSFLAQQYNDKHSSGENVGKWWGEVSIRIDDMYMIKRAMENAEYIDPNYDLKVTEGIVSRTSQTEKRIDQAIDIIVFALSQSPEFRGQERITRGFAVNSFSGILDELATKLRYQAAATAKSAWPISDSDIERFFYETFRDLKLPSTTRRKRIEDSIEVEPLMRNAMMYLAKQYNNKLVDHNNSDWRASETRPSDWWKDVMAKIRRRLA